MLGLVGAFERAVEWVRKEIENGKPLLTIMLTMPEFKDEKLIINKIYSFNPLIIGYSDSKLGIEINPKLRLEIDWVAKTLGLKTIVTPPVIHIVRDSEQAGIIYRDGYGASDSVLLEELSNRLSRRKDGFASDVRIKDSWIGSAKILLGTQQFRRFLLAVLLFIFLPTSVSLYICINYPSILGGAVISILVSITVFFLTAIITYLYLRKRPSTR